MSLPDLLNPLRLLVGTVLARCHDLLVPLGAPPSVAWLLAVVALVVLVRTLLLPLAVGQARSARRMRALAPELRRLQERHRGRTDAASLAREQGELYRAHGVRPLGALLPALVQVPVFLALVQALEQAAHGGGGAALASFAVAAVIGAPLAASALGSAWPGALVGIGLLVVTAAAQALTQHLAGGPPWLLALPVVTAAAGLAFPIGVTAYWCASALWTLGQQTVLTRLLREA